MIFFALVALEAQICFVYLRYKNGEDLKFHRLWLSMVDLTGVLPPFLNDSKALQSAQNDANGSSNLDVFSVAAQRKAKDIHYGS